MRILAPLQAIYHMDIFLAGNITIGFNFKYISCILRSCISKKFCNKKNRIATYKVFETFGNISAMIWQVSYSIFFLLHLFFVYCHIRKSYAFNYGINIELEATCVEFLVSVFMWPQKHFLLKIRF